MHFSEHGAIMAATVLNTTRANDMSVYVVRAFTKLRQVLATHQELAQKLAELEGKVIGHDDAIRMLVEAIRQLMVPPPQPRRGRIGFAREKEELQERAPASGATPCSPGSATTSRKTAHVSKSPKVASISDFTECKKAYSAATCPAAASRKSCSSARNCWTCTGENWILVMNPVTKDFSLLASNIPRHVWGWLDGRLYEASLINRAQGWYKAWPLEEVERPRDDEQRLNWVN
jgi:hypothetical protein